MNIASQTIAGSYQIVQVPMPDGTTVDRVVQKAKKPDGTIGWEFVDEKVAAFDAAFAETHTVPAPFTPPTTEVLTPKDPLRIHSSTNKTKRDVQAHLIEALGDPERLIAQGRLDTQKLQHLNTNKSEASTLRRLCIIVGGPWNQVVGMIPRY
jgi:hypothetical protein